MVESGKLNRSNIYATICEIIDDKKAGCEKDEERITCITIGTGALDVAVASLAYQKALAKGVWFLLLCLHSISVQYDNHHSPC